jgi:alkylation response protein AidB-like acyl-CoA dehydrogenase
VTDETLRMLADSAGAFARLEGDVPVRSRSGDRSVWREIGQQGWLSILVPETAGGIGLGVTHAAAVAHKFGYAALAEPFVAGGVMAPLCLASRAHDREWSTRLQNLMSGRLLATVSWQPPDGSQEIDDTLVTAREEGSEIVLHGSSRFAPAAKADAFILLAHLRSSLGLLWVERTTPGLEIIVERCADGTDTAFLILDNVRLAFQEVLAEASNAGALLRSALDSALIVTSAELLGIIDRVLEMTLEYLRNRRQFGVSIGSFQALQHRAANLWIQQQVSNAAIDAAARLLDDPASTSAMRTEAASGVKARVSDSAYRVCMEALQLHGAIGFSEEYGLGRYLNRMLTLSAWLGNAAYHRNRFGASVLARETRRAGGQFR